MRALAGGEHRMTSEKPLRPRVKGIIILCFVLLITIFAYNYYSALTKKDTQFKPDKEDLSRVTKLLTAVNGFKETSFRDFQQAIFLFASDEAAKKFKTLTENIWVQTNPQIGWSFFISTSVHAVGGAEGRTAIVAFYHPWSDVFLITAWNTDKDVPQIIDADMLLGDWIRLTDKAVNANPHWLRAELFAPAALGNSVAESIASFEQIFPAKSIRNWRKNLKIQNDQKAMNDVNYPTIAIRLYHILKNIENFRTAGKNDPRMESCRAMTIQSLTKAANGRVDDILKNADETLPEATNKLKSLKPELFRTFEAVAVMTGRDWCLVFLSSVQDASGSISLLFRGKAKKLALKRIDVVDYQGFYKNLRQTEMAAAKAGGR